MSSHVSCSGSRPSATVVVSKSAVDHLRSSGSSLLAPLDARGRAVIPTAFGNREFSWTPERVVKGPLTVIVSKADQRVVVLRNGVEIGRSVAEINDDDPGSHVITLIRGPNGQTRWIYVGLPGHEDDEGRQLDEATVNRLRLPRSFYDRLKAALVPGATMLITQSSVGDDGHRGRITIMDAVASSPG
jgi:hypothetical protein